MDDEANNLFRGEDGTALRIYTRAVKNNFLSEKHGRPIFDTGRFAEIITPGSTESVPEVMLERIFAEEYSLGGERVTEKTEYATRFKAQYEAYLKQNGDQAIDGLPINAWPLIDAGTAATLRAQGIATVEQLAAISDGALGNLGIGGRELREKAKAFVTARQFGIPVAEQAAETESVRRDLDVITAERDDLRRQLDEARRDLADAERRLTTAASEAAQKQEAPDPFKSIGNDTGGQSTEQAIKEGQPTKPPKPKGQVTI